MTDKFKDTFPIEVQFTEGEQPAAQKLTGWANQTNRGLLLLEKAVGDLWNQSQSPGTPLYGIPNQIVNLARAIGQMQALNPRVLGDLSVAGFTEAVPADSQQFTLLHTPSSGLLFSPSGGAFTTLKLTKAQLLVDGDYFVDAAQRTVWTRSKTGSGISVTYTYEDANSSYTNATFNVIPHFNQVIKCNITLNAGGAGVHEVALPLITHDQDGILTTGIDPNYNQQATLPFVLSTLAPNDIIASGFLSLWDHQSNRILEGATYFYQDQQRVYVTGVELDAGNARYSIITVGNSLTGAVDYLLDKMLNHAHRNDGSSAIQHGNLRGLITGGLTDKGGTNSLSFSNSKIANNDHAQYLHRAGYKYNKTPDTTDEGTYNNAMVGDILMGSTQKAGGTVEYVNLSANSFELIFGNDTGDAPRFGYVQADDKLQMKGTKPMRINSGSLFLGQDSPAGLRRIVAEIGSSVEPEIFYDPGYQSWRIGREGGTDIQNLIGVPIGAVIDWWRHTGLVPVPFGFVVADGAPVSDPLSPMFGIVTPDCRNKFVRGHATMPTTGFTSGGADTFGLPAHNHTLSLAANIKINDLIPFFNVDIEDPDLAFDAFPPSGGATRTYNLNVTTNSISNNGGATVNTVPAYVGLNKIIRIK